MHPPLHLGLTGGIGSGKSTVAHLLVQFGAGLVDADLASKQATATDGSAIAAIANTFGASFITADGALDRVKMRQHCFADATAREQLEAIVHPIVQTQLRTLAQALVQSGKRLIVWDIPLLVESNRWRPTFDRVCVVDCSVNTQVERVIARSQLQGSPMQREQVLAIIAAQASRAQRLTCADIVIHNESIGLNQLTQITQNVAQELADFQNLRHSRLSSAL